MTVAASQRADTMRRLALQHLAFEDLGLFAPVLAQAGYEIEYRQAGVTPLSREEWRNADLVVMLGGPIAAYDADLPMARRGDRRPARASAASASDTGSVPGCSIDGQCARCVRAPGCRQGGRLGAHRAERSGQDFVAGHAGRRARYCIDMATPSAFRQALNCLPAQPLRRTRRSVMAATHWRCNSIRRPIRRSSNPG